MKVVLMLVSSNENVEVAKWLLLANEEYPVFSIQYSGEAKLAQMLNTEYFFTEY